MTPTNGNALLAQGVGQNKNDSAAIVNDVPAQVKSFTYPDPHTVHGQALGVFLAGYALTTLDARPLLHTTTITQAVQKLKGAGWPILTERVAVQTSDGDRTANIGRYVLPQNTIALAGERGVEYARECARIRAERGRA